MNPASKLDFAPSMEQYNGCTIFRDNLGWMWRDQERMTQGGPFRFNVFARNDVDMYRRELARSQPQPQ